MPLIKVATDIIGLVTIALISIVSILGLVCICRSLYFQLWIRKSGYHRLNYFNGPWLTRIALILVVFWWGFGEVVRLSFVNGAGKFFSDHSWQLNVCKFYVVSNLGFAEPGMFLLLAFLLSAALQKHEFGTLNRKWNQKTISSVVLLCSPSLIWEICVVLIGPRITTANGQTMKVAKYWCAASSVTDGDVTCTYPLLSSIFLGLFYIILITYVTHVGSHMLSLVINNGLRQRIYVLTFAVIILLPLRAMLLGFSVLPLPGAIAHEAFVFTSFLVLLLSAMVGIVMLVYFPVADTFAVGDKEHTEMEAVPEHMEMEATDTIIL